MSLLSYACLFLALLVICAVVATLVKAVKRVQELNEDSNFFEYEARRMARANEALAEENEDLQAMLLEWQTGQRTPYRGDVQSGYASQTPFDVQNSLQTVQKTGAKATGQAIAQATAKTASKRASRWADAVYNK